MQQNPAADVAARIPTAGEIAKIERVALREVWRHEAYGFTRWLELNVDALNDVLDISLVNVERERSAGNFSVDLVAEDETGHLVVIENQLEKSDHDHLGKLVTYVSALEAKAAIWIVADHRPEHVAAVTWLNEYPEASFYLVKVEAIRIGGSPPAPLLTRIVGPSVETRQVGATKQERAERHDLRFAFWTALLEHARTKTALHSSVSPNTDTWLSAGSGRSGMHFTYVVRKHDAGAYLIIEGPDEGANAKTFYVLAEHKDEIEGAFGGALVWDRVEGRKRCQIGVALGGGGYRSPTEEWSAIHRRMVDSMTRLEEALRPHLAVLPG